MKRFDIKIGRETHSYVHHIELTIYGLQNMTLNVIHYGTMQRSVIIDLMLMLLILMDVILKRWKTIMYDPLNIGTFANN